MVLPAKCEGPLHLHDDVEEVFFMLKGQITLMIQDGDSYTETVLREREPLYREVAHHMVPAERSVADLVDLVSSLAEFPARSGERSL